MVKKALLILLILVFIGLCYAATNDPWDGTKWNTSAPDIDQPYGTGYLEVQDLRKGVALRMNKEHETLATSSEGGVHTQGSARAFFQDAAPTTQIDGTAWDSGDTGSFWFDTNASPDNLFYVLTNHASTGTWTLVSTSLIAELLAANRTFAGTLTVTGQSTFNDHINLGAADDLIGSSTSDINFGSGNFTVAGDTGNTTIGGTASVGGTLDVTGNIDPTSYETTNGGFLDEDAMGSNAANKVASQQSIKAYITAQIAANVTLSVYTNEDSDGVAMEVDHAYLAATDGFVSALGSDVDATEYMRGFVDNTNDPAGAGTLVRDHYQGTNSHNARVSIYFAVKKGEYFEITTDVGIMGDILWMSMGTLSKPVDQD